MSKVNIPKSNDDPFHRYCRNMPILTNVKTKTLLTNTNEICKAIYRTPQQISKWLSTKIGCPVSVEKNGMLTFNSRSLTPDTLENAIEEYITEKVLCINCENPETEYKKVGIYCRACGFIRKYSNDKYHTYIVSKI
jgi:translation initiation factor 2 beta subunit (eIF-2beta)/eIF-5